MDPFSLTLVVAVIGSGFMAWSVGAESSSPPLAPAVGANALPVMRAALLVGIFAGLGAVFQGASVSEAVGKELILGVSITPLAAASGLLTAAFLIFLGVRSGYPVPAAFTVTGAIVGVGLSMGGDPAIGKYREIALMWATIPLISGGIAYGTAYLLRREDVPESLGIPLLGALVGFALANVPLTVISAEGGAQGTVSTYASLLSGTETQVLVGGYDAVMLVTSLLFALFSFAVLRRWLRGSMDRGTKRFLVVLGSVVAFSGGGSQVGLATGPIQAVFETSLQIPVTYLLLFGGAGILVGSWTGAPKIIHAVSREYAILGARRSIAALVPAFLLAQVAIAYGIPVSFNEIIISSIVGSGLVEGSTGLSRSKIVYTVAAWLVAIAASGTISFGLYGIISTLTGVT